MKNKSVYQDCPNCWGYQEYEQEVVKESDQPKVEKQPTSLFKISGATVEEDDFIYKN
ncbi:hypothetical protein [Flammeovirga sp. EKP202]|uniref:hypothetical protein n=1 Tax=Flammeovirga sp. EKP202 TaxID=2770592 RepID=UPI00165ED39C|nr:hypothetical protein [Flammeovirga sp. EKP202]MBD0401000.1 hypothetical protein [Flammeovirga sp. EKP202]